MVKKRTKKRKKKSGVVYFAVNNRIENMVKIGMTIDSVEERLNAANRKNEFMCGTWSITQKVKTNDVSRTESLAHTLFDEHYDEDSVSTEMYFIPTKMTVKEMADNVREKDRIHVVQMEEQEKAERVVLEAQKKLVELQKKHKGELKPEPPESEPTDMVK